MNEVVLFLQSVASKEGFSTFDSTFGNIYLGEKHSFQQSSGAVYGIFVESITPPQVGFTKLPGFDNWQPLYWGKDMTPPSRIRAHVQGHSGNGNIDLKSIKEISGRRLIFGAIFVSEYAKFERLLHAQFPPLKGRNSAGRSHTVTKVIG
ncbi:hypothetical protein [Herbaspirillum rubrisubalbicans]|uniref:hypothetical protein n=1 Tax=Herbaspirillum rubrisubalbicans TaxID=80842 RepID=UPI0012F6AC9D|nr:hypothetical protein [Herbaspirillum rubrisubalbicans]